MGSPGSETTGPMVANKTRMALVPPCRNPVYTRLAFVGAAQFRKQLDQ